jgi:hypothetical protein
MTAPQAHVAVVTVVRAHLPVYHHLHSAVATLKAAALLADTFSSAIAIEIDALASLMSFHPFSPNEKTSSRLAALDSKDYLTILFVRYCCSISASLKEASTREATTVAGFLVFELNTSHIIA